MVKFITLKKDKSIFNLSFEFAVINSIKNIMRNEGSYLGDNKEKYVRKIFFLKRIIDDKNVSVVVEYFFIKNLVKIKIMEKTHEN